jgi:hypothetical protein
MHVERGAADEVLLDLECAQPGLVQEGDDCLHLGHYLRTDTVARQKEELVRHGFRLRNKGCLC